MTTQYHEKETVYLKAQRRFDRVSLDKWLRDYGFKAEDDFYYIPRKDRCEPWQSPTVLSIDIRLAGKDVYETEEDVVEGRTTQWDELKIEYLLASVPRDCIKTLIGVISELIRDFPVGGEYMGERVTTEILAHRLNEIADRLTKEWDAPGSETLAILIEQAYGRG